MKKNTNGRSIKITRVEELKNSRNVSNSRTVPAIAPVFCRCSSGDNRNIRSNKRREITKSALFEATSINLAGQGITLVNGTTYYFRVRAIDQGLAGTYGTTFFTR